MVSQKEELQVEGMEDQKIRCVGWVETEAEMRRRKRQEEKQENEGEEGKALKWSFNHTVIYSHPAGGKEDCSRAEQSRAEQWGRVHSRWACATGLQWLLLHPWYPRPRLWFMGNLNSLRCLTSQKCKINFTRILGVTDLVLSRFSGVRLFVTPWTGAHQASLSMEFSRQ